MKNVRKSLITTILGFMFIIAGVASVFVSTSMTWWDASIVIGIGIMLIFSPDTLILKAGMLLNKQKETVQNIENVVVPEEPLIEEKPHVELIKAKSGTKKKSNVKSSKKD